MDLTQIGSYTWGATTLVHMYDSLNDASKSMTRQLVGYITLLQCWIYEHFPSSGKASPISIYRRRLDRLTSDVVCWIPYGDYRASREFEDISDGVYLLSYTREGCTKVWTIPPHLATTFLCIKDIDDRWIQFSKYTAPIGQICSGDPPRQPPVQQHDTFKEPHVAQHPMATMGMNEAAEDAYAGVERPRHAVEACQAMGKRLERLLNLRKVTKGTKTYNVMEDCLRIARGVTVDHNVYVRSRRRQRVVRQFGYVQMIPPHSPGSRLCLEDIDDKWMHFSDYLALVGQICVVPGQYAPDYM
ncbi:Protein MAIN-LIKE 1 [Glycine max]|nr:Protein MAIN-LIKE 1 [Glycine max]